MPTQRSNFPIPKFWIFIFSVVSCQLLFILSAALTIKPVIKFQSILFVASIPIVVFTIFFLLHKVGLFAESRGWIYYRKPRTTGMGAGVVLDLEIWVSGRNSHVEHVRMAREALTEGQEETGESGDSPEPGKENIRFRVK